ncbi:peptidoglycan binding domain-containing protein, partial [mine drainage metagenome]
DPDYLARNHLRVFDAQGQPVAADSIHWTRPPAGLTLRQEPGPGGALGLVAFRFANTHEVYLHDTPHKALFAQTRRAFSSGCVRVENAMELAQLLLNDPTRWNAESLQTAASYDVTRDVPLDPPVPLRMIYWTVDAQDGGRVGVVPDVYRQDPASNDCTCGSGSGSGCGTTASAGACSRRCAGSTNSAHAIMSRA